MKLLVLFKPPYIIRFWKIKLICGILAIQKDNVFLSFPLKYSVLSVTRNLFFPLPICFGS